MERQPRLWGAGLDESSPGGRCGGPAPGLAGHQPAPIPSSLTSCTPSCERKVWALPFLNLCNFFHTLTLKKTTKMNILLSLI
ncbi:hypothetical protein HanRHA438_Chr08g0334851 [Helianthus annuus]|nr:hypothetical protein HanRHA438_Chr08g0334851 [Helianthus annuus]